jgi:hypothetical protein
MTDFAAEIEAFLASFSPDEAAVMRHTFRAILAGAPVTVADLPAASGLPGPAVGDAVRRLLERGTLVMEDGRITGSRGLSLTETSHRLVLAGRPRYAFCAVDAVGIPVALGVDATVDSRCHHCHRPLRLEIRDGAITEAPPGLTIWAVERDLTRSLRAHT